MQQIYRKIFMPKCDFNSIKLLCNFIQITLWHGCSPVNLLRMFRTSFLTRSSMELTWMATVERSVGTIASFERLKPIQLSIYLLDKVFVLSYYWAEIYFFKFNNGNTRTLCEICSKLTIQERDKRLHCLFWTDLTHCCSVDIDYFDFK